MTDGILCLGVGRLSGACVVGDENVIIIKRGGALYVKRLLSGRKIVEDGLIGYCDDIYLFPGGTLKIDAESEYEANNK